MNVIARSLVFPVTAVASGLLYVVDNIEEYVSTGPSMQETERHIQKVTVVASGKVSSPATSQQIWQEKFPGVPCICTLQFFVVQGTFSSS